MVGRNKGRLIAKAGSTQGPGPIGSEVNDRPTAGLRWFFRPPWWRRTRGKCGGRKADPPRFELSRRRGRDYPFGKQFGGPTGNLQPMGGAANIARIRQLPGAYRGMNRRIFLVELDQLSGRIPRAFLHVWHSTNSHFRKLMLLWGASLSTRANANYSSGKPFWRAVIRAWNHGTGQFAAP